MGVRQPELGGLVRFEMRPGVAGFPAWGGHILDGDAGSTPISRFRWAQNVRFRNGEVTERPGQFKITEEGVPLHADNACVAGLIDYQLNAARNKLWIVTVGCLGVGVSASGATVFNYDPEQEPQFQQVTFFTGRVDKRLPMASYGSDLYIGDNALLRVMRLRAIDYGDTAFDFAGRASAESIEEFTGFTISTMYAFDSFLFIGLNNGAGASKIVTWDGKSLRDDITGIDPPVTMTEWRDQLVVGFGIATNHIRLRAKGSSPGSWTTVAPGAGTVAVPGENSMLSYRNDLWIADGDMNLWKYDGSSLAIARTIAGADTVVALAEMNEYLYYGWSTGATLGAGHAKVGQYYGVSGAYVDTHKDLGDQFPLDGPVSNLVAYKGNLIAGLTGTRVFISPGPNTVADWFSVHDDVGSSLNFPPVQFMVF